MMYICVVFLTKADHSFVCLKNNWSLDI